MPRLSAHGLVQNVGWPSPFTRIGPGLCGAPIPSFSAEGGNTNDAYGFTQGLGVWGVSATGLLEDKIGTSHACPILAREAAFTLQKLQEVCEPGSQPFAVTARAFLTLTAEPPVADQQVQGPWNGPWAAEKQIRAGWIIRPAVQPFYFGRDSSSRRTIKFVFKYRFHSIGSRPPKPRS